MQNEENSNQGDSGTGTPAAVPPRPTIPNEFAQPGRGLKMILDLEGKRLLGTISKVDGPGRFYIVTNDHRFYKAVASMDIQNFYKDNPRAGIPVPELLRHGLFVACLQDGIWVRAKIFRVILLTHCRVELVDSGQFRVVRITDIRYLHKEFLETPAFASECRLSPIVSGARWGQTKKSLDEFYDSVQVGVTVFAKFIKRTRDSWTNDYVWEVRLKRHIRGGHPYYDTGYFSD